MPPAQPPDDDNTPSLLNDGAANDAGRGSPPDAKRDRQTPSDDGDMRGASDDDGVELVRAVATGDPSADDRALVNETFLPVHGLVRLSPREMRVINHPAFQRLFEIFQLGQTRFVYRGATHMRGEHSVGALHVVTIMADALERNCARGRPRLSEEWQLDRSLSDTERALVRLGALLHDIGHLAAGHTLEDELGVLPAHDADERMNLVLDRTEWHGRTYPSLRVVVDDAYGDEAVDAAQRESASDHVLTASQLVLLLVSKDHARDRATNGTAFRVEVCRDLIGNTICADLLDYLHRDWLHLGKPRHLDLRLLEYLAIWSRQVASGRVEHKLAINLKGGTRPRPDAVSAVIDLLESRYQLAEIALFHRVKVAAASMLERIIAELLDTFASAEERRVDLDRLQNELLECSDVQMLDLLEQRLAERRRQADGDAEHIKRLDGAIDLTRRLHVRLLHKEFAAFYDDDLRGRGQNVRRRFNGDPRVEDAEERHIDTQRAAAERLLALRVLEADFGLEPGSVVMYCPGLKMNTKIAEVNVLLEGDIEELAAVELRDHRVTGGHLKAQQERFQRLWRVTFALERDVHARLERADLLSLLHRTVEIAVLGVDQSPRTPDRALQSVADELVVLPGSPWKGKRTVTAGSNRAVANESYPGNLRSLRARIAG